MKFEHIETYNFDGAIRAMRNPLDSWNNSDSKKTDSFPFFEIGEKDLGLAQRLISGGTEHSKFMRQIFISIDITAPLYWWSEADTYKVGTVADSCSTMHTLSKYPITKEMFSFDGGVDIADKTFEPMIKTIELLRQFYNGTKDYKYFRLMKQLLPSCFNQKRTWTANYAVLRTMYIQRRNHRLTEWHDFCKMVESLPYAKELILYGLDEVK